MKPKINKAVHSYYKKLSRMDDYDWLRWSEKRKRFRTVAANEFFVGVMLDQRQKAERAWDGASYFVENYFSDSNNFWLAISKTHLSTLKKICQKGYGGKSFAPSYNYNKFPKYLKSAANKMLDEYDGDPTNIWAVPPDQIQDIYDRLKEFDGIGDALAKMGQFILVRHYGVAGGRKSKHLMAIKPDVLVNRVMYRTGVSPSSRAKDVIESTNNLRLKSPADFDAAVWVIGREFCFKKDPNCAECPLSKVCKRVGL